MTAKRKREANSEGDMKFRRENPLQEQTRSEEHDTGH
jgi:hypothetical protein